MKTNNETIEEKEVVRIIDNIVTEIDGVQRFVLSNMDLAAYDLVQLANQIFSEINSKSNKKVQKSINELENTNQLLVDALLYLQDVQNEIRTSILSKKEQNFYYDFKYLEEITGDSYKNYNPKIYLSSKFKIKQNEKGQ